MKHILIGLLGGQKSGKSTAAEMIQDIMGDQFVMQLSFAQPLKEALEHIFTDVDTDTQEGKAALVNGKASVRELLQSLGDWAKEVDMGVFTNHVRYEIQEVRAATVSSVLVVTDVRQPSEADMIRAEGGHIVGFTRGRELVDLNHGHPIECEFLKVQSDTLVDNRGSMPETLAQLRVLLEKL